jgi:hypothetical protein
MEVLAHFRGSNLGFFCNRIWQDSAKSDDFVQTGFQIGQMEGARLLEPL